MVAGIRAWQWILSAAPLIAMSYGAVRHVPLAATWAAPVITAIAGRLSASAAAPAFRRLWTAVGSVALVPIVLTIEFVLARPGPAIAMGAATLGSKDPCRVAAFMRQNDVRGNVYTPLWWGSYLTWEAYPAIRVSMDGRNISLFPDAMVGENLRFYSRDAGPADLDSPFRYDTDFLLVPADAAILPRVRDDRRWRRIYADDDAQLFVRAGDSHAAMQAPLVFSTPPCPSTLPAAAQLQ